MENIILELRKGEKENIYGGEGRVVYVTKAAGIFIFVFLPCVSREILENCKSL